MTTPTQSATRLRLRDQLEKIPLDSWAPPGHWTYPSTTSTAPCLCPELLAAAILNIDIAAEAPPRQFVQFVRVEQEVCSVLGFHNPLIRHAYDLNRHGDQAVDKRAARARVLALLKE